MFNFLKSLFPLRFVVIPLICAAIFYAIISYNLNRYDVHVKSESSFDYFSLNKLSKKWIENTYRSVGLGVSEGMQSDLSFFSGPKALYVNNPITDFALRNNLSIACLQMDQVRVFEGKPNVFVLEGNITFKGDFPFNKIFNNNVLYTKTFLLRVEEEFLVMSSSINMSKPRNEYKDCSSLRVSSTRNIRFDNYLEQMNSLTFPYSLVSAPVTNLNQLKERTNAYITNEEYVSHMKANAPSFMQIQKTSKSEGALLGSILSVPGLLNANAILEGQTKAIDADRAAARILRNDLSEELNVRAQYLTRMAVALNCEQSSIYKDICDLGSGIIYK